VRHKRRYAREPGIPSGMRDTLNLYGEIFGVGSGVGWLFMSLRRGAGRCAMGTPEMPINRGDFRGAAFCCGVMREA